MHTAAVRAAILVAAVVAAGCSTTSDWSELGANPREFFNLNAPVTQAGAELDGGRVTLRRGQALVVRLDEQVGTDLRWEMQRYDGPTVIAPVRHDLTAKPGVNPAATTASCPIANLAEGNGQAMPRSTIVLPPLAASAR